MKGMNFMITKTFICDACKKSVGESELFNVSISITVPKQPNTYSQKLVSASKDICKSCLEKRGILAIVPGDKSAQEVEAANKKTVETKFIDILEDLGVAFTD
jgi:hypothetical protein